MNTLIAFLVPLRGGGFGGGFGIVSLVVIALLIGLVIYLLLRDRKRTAPVAAAPIVQPQDDALRVLADRLARGEIGVDEYQERVAVLRGTPLVPQPPAQPE